MRVRIVRGGGIAGVLTETSLDDADLALVTWDRDLGGAAAAAGLAVVPKPG